MKGSTWAAGLPGCLPGSGNTPAERNAAYWRMLGEIAERNRLVVEAAQRGIARFDWAPLRIEAKLSDGKMHVAELTVMADAMLVGEDGDYVRPSMTQPTAQRICDLICALMPTEKIIDQAWLAAVLKLPAQTMPPDSYMSSTPRMIENSAMVQRQIEAHGFQVGGYKNGSPAGIIGNTAKCWAITNKLEGRPEACANAGWHDVSGKSKFVTPGGLHVLQPLATAHTTTKGQEANHDDYSQKGVYWVYEECIVDGSVMRTADLYTHPLLSQLVSYEGPLRLTRHPAVERTGAAPSRPLQRGDKGDAVKVWQQWLLKQGYDLGPWKADGDFGKLTEEATRLAQARAGIPITGVLDGPTEALMGKPPGATTHQQQGPFAFDVEFFPLVANLVSSRKLAKWYGATKGRVRRKLGVHTIEAVELLTTAEACANYFSNPGVYPKGHKYAGQPIKVSAHFTLDADSTVQCVSLRDVAFAAPGMNHDGVQIEFTGFARQTAAEWADPFSTRMLLRGAALFAALAYHDDIPIRLLSVEELRDDPDCKGIATHAASSLAFRKSDHTDPGKHFPMEWFLDRIREEFELIR